MKPTLIWKSMSHGEFKLGLLFFFSIAVIVFAGVSANNNDEPQFTEPIPNITIAAGRDVTLPCIVENIGNYRVAWIHTDKHTLLSLHDKVITRNPRYSISHNSYRTWWLHIANVQQEDSGQYMCQINTSPMKSQSGFLNIVVPPQINETETSSDTDVREGSDVSLKCVASGSPAPKIKWRREDGLDITIGKKKVSSFHGEHLNITKASRLHMGAYLCIASNGIPPSVSKRILLNVNFSPMIWIPNQLVGAPVGTDVMLDCNLESYPNSVTYWSREGGIMVISNVKYDTMIMDHGLYKSQMRLRIRNLRPDDFGLYICVAKNSLGETEGTIRLYEIPRPTETTMTSQALQTVSKGEEVQHTTSDKIFGSGSWQNSLPNDGKEVKKIEFSTEILERDQAIGLSPSTAISNQNINGPTGSASSSKTNGEAKLSPLRIKTFLIFESIYLLLRMVFMV